MSKSFSFAADRVSRENTPEKLVCLILSMVIALVFVVSLAINADMSPATFDDYFPLNERLLAVEGNPSNLLEGDGEIVINGKIITYTVENKECKMTATYDSDYKLIKKAQEDKAFGIGKLIICCLALFALTAFFLYFVSFFFIFAGSYFYSLFSEMKKASKEKKKKVNCDETEDSQDSSDAEGSDDSKADEEQVDEEQPDVND